MNIRPYLEHRPEIDESCYIDPACVVIGEVSLAEQVSVWPFAVIRGDVNSIHIGARSNVQDLSMLHVSHKNEAKPEGSPLVIGEDVTIGHKVMLHGCRTGNRVLGRSQLASCGKTCVEGQCRLHSLQYTSRQRVLVTT